ncbi:MAG: ribonuclease J [Alphaproteobacteria bacterium]|nr:ribonuclease J [Alphaproteobacteria bacterium]
MKKVNQSDFASGFYFLPLGGSEQFGVNFNLYCCDGKWLILDCGIGFADERFPNVDIFLPDPEFIEPYKKDIAGLVITHGHEDHIGAVPYLWPRLKCPIYATKFTAAVLRAKFRDFPNCKDAKIIEIDSQGDAIEVGPFSLEFIHVAHSIPQAVSTVISTPYGRVVHSGDWNLDPAPVLGAKTDEAAFRAVGERGVLAYIGDSTNAPIPGRAGSESEVEQGLATVFEGIDGRILVTIFASNVGRIQSICRAAEKVGRSVCLLGRSLHRMVSNAGECGFLTDIHDFVPEADLPSLPADKTLIIATGSQGEARAALARISRGDWKGLKMGRKDVAVFSSKAIPGNEKEINNVKNHLSAGGVRIIDTSNAGCRIHVSGHPYRDEIRDMYEWVKPEWVIPVHGEYMMLAAQASLAQECGIKHTIIPQNGSVIRLGPGEPKLIDHVPSGVLAVEPQRIIKSNHAAITERRKLQFSGAAHITLALDSSGRLAFDPHMTLIGLIDEKDEGEQDILGDLLQEIEDTLVDLMDDGVADDVRIEEDVRVACRRYLMNVFGFKPKVSIHLLRV